MIYLTTLSKQEQGGYEIEDLPIYKNQLVEDTTFAVGELVVIHCTDVTPIH